MFLAIEMSSFSKINNSNYIKIDNENTQEIWECIFSLKEQNRVIWNNNIHIHQLNECLSNINSKGGQLQKFRPELLCKIVVVKSLAN